MTRHRRILLGGFLVALLCAALAWLPGRAAHQPEKDFQADEEIQVLAVKIDIGAGGADLDEPVAFDPGLGFLFWLHPVGRQTDEVPPFGAVPQQSTVQGKVVPAGTSAAFTFSVQAEAGLDKFRTTSQLLPGIRVADISRIGFASEGKSSWTLAGYEIQINGKVFASKTNMQPAEPPAANKQKLDELDKKIVPAQKELADLQAVAQAKLATPDDLKQMVDVEATLKALLDERSKLLGAGGVGVQAKATQDAARTRLGELSTQMAPLVSQWFDARTLVQTGLAEDADRQRLSDLQNSLEPLVRERTWLEGQLKGKYPWFQDKDFKPAMPDVPAVQSARVTLVTAMHPGADTHNYVYFHTGGHKYLLASADKPLLVGALQVYRLDLLAGPLLPTQLRDFGVGMIGAPIPYAQAPDRWHPQRLVVEIDGKIVYDSDQVAQDQKSLDAIRLVPPVHEDETGNLVVDELIDRVQTDWTAGKATGLDPVTGDPVPLPAKDNPLYPQPEPGPVGTAPPVVVEPPVDQQNNYFPGEYIPPAAVGPDLNQPFPDPVAPNFPGAGGGIVGDGGVDGTIPANGGMQDGGQGGALPDWFLNWLANLVQQLQNQGNTNPAGTNVEVDKVRITQGFKADDQFTVTWDVYGDESTIDHYVVQLLKVDVEHPGNLYPQSYDLQLNVPAGGLHSATAGPIQDLVNDPQMRQYGLFVAPNVTAVPKDPANNIPGKTGPARAICPVGTDTNIQARPPTAYRCNGTFGPVSIGGAVPPGQAGVWLEGLANSHLAVEFESIATGWNVAIRPQAPTDTIDFRFRSNTPVALNGGFPINPPPPSKFRLVGYLGFLGGAGANNQTNVDMASDLEGRYPPPLFGGWHNHPQPLVQKNPNTPQGGADAGMVLIDQIFDVTTLPANASRWDFNARLTFTNFGTDDAHPPALFGVRLIPQ